MNKLPEFKPLPEVDNLRSNYMSAFNHGMNIYEALVYLQGYVQITYNSMDDLINDWNSFEQYVTENISQIANEKTQEILNQWKSDGTLNEIIVNNPQWALKVNKTGDVMSGDLQFQESTGVYGTSASGQKVNLAKTRHVGSSNYVDIGHDDSQAVIYSNDKPIWSKNGKNKDLITEEDISNIVNQFNSTFDVLEARMDKFTSLEEGSTTGDAELQDIRVGYNGKVYANAGDAVRDQVSQLNSDLNDVAENIGFYVQNIFDYTNVTNGKSINTTIGSDINYLINNENCFVSNQIWEVKKGDVIYFSVGYVTLGVYNEEGKLVEQFSNSADTNYTITNDNAKSLRYGSIISNGYLEKFMMCINHELPESYVPYNKSISDVDNIKISVEENKSEIENIKSELSQDKKAVIILDFDQAIEEIDNRISIMNNYGWKPSFVGGATPEITKKLLADGWDLSTYWNSSNVPTDEQLSGETPADLEACKLYVRTGLESQEEYGFFNPISWSCRQNKYGETLGKALKFYGYKICRGGGNDGFSQDINEDFTRTNSTGIYSDNLSNVKTAIDNAISNKQAINIFTHYIVDSAEEDRGYDCLKTVYIELMEYIKSKVEEGLCTVMNYREFYQKAFPEKSYEIDYERNIKRMNFIESNIS